MKKHYALTLILILIFSLNIFYTEPPKIIISIDKGIKIDENRFRNQVYTIVSTYSKIFNFTLDKPLYIHVTKHIKFRCIAYTCFDGKKYWIETKTTNFHVIAHELIHVFQYIRWKYKLNTIAEKWNWFVEGFAEAIPIYLFNTTPIINHARLDTYNGLINQYPHPLMDRNMNKPYYTRIFFLYLFKQNFTDTIQRYFSVKDTKINPFHQMYRNQSIRQYILKNFWLNNTNYISTYSYFFYRPFIKYTGAEAIWLPQKYGVETNATCLLYIKVNQTLIPYECYNASFPAKLIVINLSNSTLKIVLRGE